MIVVLASRFDATAPVLVERWKAYDAVLFTVEDLSVRGWRYYPSAIPTSTGVLGGREIAVGAIRGVLTRLPSVWEHELHHIVPTDRRYVAAEMSAFLLCWLSTLPCPILNKPTPSCLSGPLWRPEQWVLVANEVGMRIRPRERRVSLMVPSLVSEPEPPTVTVTVVGLRSFGAVEGALKEQARRLADAADVDLLGVQFSGPDADAHFVGASLWPDLTSSAVIDAVLEYLLQSDGGAGRNLA